MLVHHLGARSVRLENSRLQRNHDEEREAVEAQAWPSSGIPYAGAQSEHTREPAEGFGDIPAKETPGVGIHEEGQEEADRQPA